jgi:hypothetical protein
MKTFIISYETTLMAEIQNCIIEIIPTYTYAFLILCSH